MFTKRHTAYKLSIKDIVSNEFVAKEGESSYVLVNGNQVSRVRLMATIVNKFMNDERKSGSLILDDGTEVISLRGWENEFHLIDKTAIGQLVEVIARVRSYNDQTYLIPEVIKKVEPDWFVLRKLELRIDKEIKKEEAKKEDNLKDMIFEKIKAGGNNGAAMDELAKICKDKGACKEILKELLEEDMIFEPRAGKYKAL